MRVETLKLGPIENNCYLLDGGAGGAVAIDPGAEPEKVIARLEEMKLEPAVIVVTHGHADHIGGITALRDRWPKAQIAIGEADAKALTNAMVNLSFYVGMKITAPKADRLLADGDAIELDAVKLKVIATPGHSPGGVCLYAEDLGGKPALFSGDTLFRESVGRCDITGGDWDTLMASLRRLMKLPDDTVVYPGHGPSTTIAYERKNNPFLNDAE